MSVITFKNIDTAKQLELHTNLNIIRSAGREIFIQDAAIYTLLIRLFTLTDPAIGYRDIADIVRGQKSSFHMEDCSDNIIANKYVFKARAALKSLMVEDFIVTVRGLGYKISPKWLLLSQRNNEDDNPQTLLTDIAAIIQDCIAYSEQAEITQDKSGLSFIKADHEVVVQHFRRMNDCYHALLSRYSAPGNSVELIELREKITKLLLYTIYWRVGDSLTDEKFRADYRNELQLILRQIKQAVCLLDA